MDLIWMTLAAIGVSAVSILVMPRPQLRKLAVRARR